MDSPEKEKECDRSLESLSAKEYQRIEARCLDSDYATGAMLKEKQTLKEVIEADQAYLNSIGITFQQIADRLNYFLEVDPELEKPQTKPKFYVGRGWSGRGVTSWTITVDGRKFEIHALPFGGAQECPFHKESAVKDSYKGYEYGSVDYVIVDTVNQVELRFGDLLLHLIEKHHFFEGPGVQYRLEPQKVVEFLQLKPGINYKVPRIDIPQWKSDSSFTGQISKDNRIIPILKKEPVLQIEGIQFYLLSEAEHRTYSEDQEAEGTLLLVVFLPRFGSQYQINWEQDFKKREQTEKNVRMLPRFKLIEGRLFDFKNFYLSTISECSAVVESYPLDSTIAKEYQALKK